MPAGSFITFEGSEGCGKTTQVARIAARLRKSGITVRELREPGGTPLGEEIRHTLKHSPNGAGMVPEAELLLMNAARAQLVREVVRPALLAGEWVLCDRFSDSTVAYQGWGRGLDPSQVRAVLEVAVGPTRPDLTFWLRVPVAEALLRTSARARALGASATLDDRFERAGEPFFERVEAGFASLAAAEPGRIVSVDATPSAEVVEATLWRALESRWPWLGTGDPGGVKLVVGK